MRLGLRWFVVVSVTGLLACEGGSGPDDGFLAPPPDGDGMQLRLNVSLEPGTEATVCKYFVVPEGGIDVGKFEHEYTEISHHILLYPTFFRAEDVTDELLWDCDVDEDIRDYIIGVVYGSQSPSESAEYPPGIGMKTFGGQVLMLEYHAINATDETVDADVRVNLWRTEEEAVSEAGTFFFYHPTIALEPGQSAKVRMRCHIPEDVKLLFGGGHMHRRGVKFSSWLEGPGIDEPIPLVSADSWDDSDTVQFEPHVDVTAGQYIEYECDFVNTESRTIYEGLSAIDNEMCVYLGSYYLLDGARLLYDAEWCDGPESYVIYTGTKSCMETVYCLDDQTQTTGWDEHRESCFMNACEAATRDAIDFLRDCRGEMCGAQCAAGDLLAGECTTCLATSCATQYDTCAAQVCQ